MTSDDLTSFVLRHKSPDKFSNSMDRIFKRPFIPFLWPELLAQERESCQFPFVLDEKPTVVPVAQPESGREYDLAVRPHLQRLVYWNVGRVAFRSASWWRLLE